MDYQYKIIVSNRTVYKEFEIAAGVENVRLGTSRLSFRYIAINGIWTVRINCILAEVTCGKYIPWRSTMEI